MIGFILSYGVDTPWANITLHFETWQSFCCHNGRHLTMGNIALAKRAHILKLKEDSICLEAGPSVFKLNHFFILGEHVFESSSFCFWNMWPVCTFYSCWRKCLHQGQSEPAVTNALVGYSVHWMGYIFSFDVKWDSS